MRFVLTACYPAADWNPPTTSPTNHGHAQTLLRYRPRIKMIRPINHPATPVSRSELAKHSYTLLGRPW